MTSKAIHSKRKRVRLWVFLAVAAILLSFKGGLWQRLTGLDMEPRTTIAQSGKDDLNGDGVVDLQDLELFSLKRLNLPWQEVDWCSWLDGNHKEQKFMGSVLEAFVREYFQCDVEPPDLSVKNSNIYPMRLALGPSGYLYVSDPKIGSVFIYDSELSVIAELKGLDKPLGVAVDDLGNIYVGNSGRRNVEVYDTSGVMTATIGKGLIKMPNDLVFDRDGKLYVADSKKDTIWVFGSNGGVIRSIGTPGDGEGQFKFPIAVEIAYYLDEATGLEIGELYVADHGHSLVKVFDLNGNFLRSFGGMVEKAGWSGWDWQGKFVSVQSLAFDSLGQLHVLDCYLDKVQILDPDTGTYLGYYGENGTDPGQLNLPMDIVIDGAGQTIVAEARNKRVEIIYP